MGCMLKRSLKIPYGQGALTARSNYKENWYAKTFPHVEGALKRYAKNFLKTRSHSRIKSSELTAANRRIGNTHSKDQRMKSP